MNILQSYISVEPYLEMVVKNADDHRDQLGFIPKNAFEKMAKDNHLWVVTNKNEELLGYLAFGGGSLSQLKVIQLCVSKDARNKGVGKFLIAKFIEYGESKSYLSILARVAADLSANKFWEKNGFVLLTQKQGGKSKNRKINIRVRDLKTPSLLSLISNSDTSKYSNDILSYKDIPISGVKTFCLDLNIIYDLIRRREHYDSVKKILNAGFSHELKIVVTPEFVRELNRNKNKSTDPLITLMEGLPTLADIPIADLGQIKEKLRKIIFPNALLESKKAVNNESDLCHIAYCVANKISGFVTNEKQILVQSAKMREQFSIDIISSFELSELLEVEDINISTKEVNVELGINVKLLADNEVQDQFLENYLKEFREGVSYFDAWHKLKQKNKVRYYVSKVREEYCGFFFWNIPNKLNKEIEFWAHLKAEGNIAEYIIDSILDLVLKDVPWDFTVKITLYALDDQTLVHKTCTLFGFLKIEKYHSRIVRYVKIARNGFINEDNWIQLRSQFKEFTNLDIQEQLPKFNEFRNTGIQLCGYNDSTWNKLFEFETLISPGLIICSKREGLVVPIRRKYSEQLFSGCDPQLSIFPVTQAINRIEKTYFRDPKNANLCEKGMPVFFYESGSKGNGRSAIIAFARVTWTSTEKKGSVKIKLNRQGVLTDSELYKIGKSDEVHAFTFSNTILLPKPIEYNILKQKELITGSNLITLQKLTSSKLRLLCEIVSGAFSG